MKSYMRVAPKRRHVPTNSAPLEVYWMLFFPNYRIVVDCVGVGFQREPVTAQVWYRQLFFSFIACIASNGLPWNGPTRRSSFWVKIRTRLTRAQGVASFSALTRWETVFSFNCRDSKMWPFTISLVMHTCHIADGSAPFYSLRQCRRNSHHKHRAVCRHVWPTERVFEHQ